MKEDTAQTRGIVRKVITKFQVTYTHDESME